LSITPSFDFREDLFAPTHFTPPPREVGGVHFSERLAHSDDPTGFYRQENGSSEPDTWNSE
jgi:hypothetical protein